MTLAAKSLLRGGRPIVLAPSTNDGLAGSAPNLASLLQRKHFYFVPFGQDDCYKKPASLKSDFTLLPDTLESAMRGVQLQPLPFAKGGAAVSFPRGAHMYGIGLLIFFLYLYCPAGNAGTFRGGYSRPQPGKRGGARWNGSR